MRKNVVIARTRVPTHWKCVMPNRPDAQPIRSNVVQVVIASVGILYVTAVPIAAMVVTKNAPLIVVPVTPSNARRDHSNVAIVENVCHERLFAMDANNVQTGKMNLVAIQR